MVRTLLVRGMLAGFVAGLLVFSFGRLVGEPQVDRALGFEAALDESRATTTTAPGEASGMTMPMAHGTAMPMAHGTAMPHGVPMPMPMPMPMEEPELVSRGVQAGLGLFTGVVVYATAFGGLFALVFAFAYGRVGRVSPRAVAALLAVGALVALYLVPTLKYPADPPAIGEPGTIGVRTAYYFLMMLASVAAMAAAVVLRTRLAPRLGGWAASLWAGGVYVAVVFGVGRFVLPAVNEVPDGFPADLLWQFRIASLGMQAILWTTIGLLFGWLTQRATAAYRVPAHGLRVT